MSKIGKKAVQIPAGVEIKIEESQITVKGKLGELQVPKFDGIEIKQEGEELQFTPANDNLKAFWGLSRSLTQNAVTGVSEGFTKELEINGVGYRAAMKGSAISLTLGKSHLEEYTAPAGVKIECPSQTEIKVSGFDKQLVGQVAANIRSFRPPEPYKGKGIKYKDEYIVRKEGKKK